MAPSLEKKMAVGVFWMLFAQFVDRSIGMGSILILARLLTPDDFGLIAMAMSIIGLLEMLGAFSFDVVLIQNQNATRVHYDTAWTFKVLLSVIIACLLLLSALPAVWFYGDARLSGIIYILTIGIFFKGFENIGIVAFRKEMTFKKEFHFNLYRKLLGLAVTIPLALLFKSYWALIAGMITGWCGGTVLSYIVHPYRPRFSLAARKDLFNFSKWLFLNNILFYFKNRSADFIIGRISSSQALGAYNLGYEIATLPTVQLVAPINRAVYPGYATMSGNFESLRKGFLNVIEFIAILAIPAGIGVAATAELIVPLALGEKWLDAIPVVQTLGIFGAIVALETNIQSIYLAIAKPHIHTYLTAVYLAFLIPGLVLGTKYFGIIGSAWATTLTALFFFFVDYYILLKVIRLSAMVLLRRTYRPVVASGVMYFVITIYQQYSLSVSVELSLIIQLAISVFFGAFVYLLVTLALWGLAGNPIGPEKIILNKAFKLIRLIFKN